MKRGLAVGSSSDSSPSGWSIIVVGARGSWAAGLGQLISGFSKVHGSVCLFMCTTEGWVCGAKVRVRVESSNLIRQCYCGRILNSTGLLFLYWYLFLYLPWHLRTEVVVSVHEPVLQGAHKSPGQLCWEREEGGQGEESLCF